MNRTDSQVFNKLASGRILQSRIFIIIIIHRLSDAIIESKLLQTPLVFSGTIRISTGPCYKYDESCVLSVPHVVAWDL